MKKILSVVALSAVIYAGNAIGAADNAEAYFEDGTLWRVVYNDAHTYEVVTDMGNMNDLLVGGLHTVGGGSDAWTPSMFGETTTFADLNVAYFACDNTDLGMFNYKEDAWVSGAAGGQTSGLDSWGTFAGAQDGMQGRYSGSSTATVKADIGAGHYNTYWANMNGSGGTNSGTFSGFIPHPNGSEAVLDDLAGLGYVDQYMYFWDDPRADPHMGELVASIRTHADGSTTVNAVPVPATVLLFGSGLLGLMGVRRRTGK